MNHPILSILICGTPRRLLTHAAPLISKLNAQAEGNGAEVLYLLDNKQRSVGLKRQALLDVARGDYVAFVDDDDDVSPDYVACITSAIIDNGWKTGPDVITFDQQADVAGHLGTVSFGLGNPNDPFTPGGVTLRNAWHVCAWKRDLAQLARFPDMMDGEDWGWAGHLCGVAATSYHIPRVLHYYFFRPSVTEATGQNHKTP